MQNTITPTSTNDSDTLLLREVNSNQTSGERLHEIALSKDCTRIMRERIVQHPNCPPDLLREYFASFPRQALLNPVLPLLLIENAQFFASLDHATALPILEEAETPGWLVEALRGHRHPEVADLAYWHKSVHPDISRDWQYKLNSWFFETAYKSSSPEAEMAELLRLRLIPEKLQSEFSRRLLLYPEEGPKFAPQKQKEEKEESKRETSVFIEPTRPEDKEEKEARSPLTSRKRLLEIAQSNNARWNRALVENPNAPAELLAIIATSTGNAVMRPLMQIALHSQTSVETQMELIKSSDLSVVRALARRNSDLADSVRLGIIARLRQSRTELGIGLYGFSLARVADAREIAASYRFASWQERLGLVLNLQLLDTQLLEFSTDANALVRTVARARRDDPRVPTWFWGNISENPPKPFVKEPSQAIE